MGLIKIKHRHWRLVARRFWGTLFTLIITLAVLVQLGRQAFPLISDYQDQISEYLGRKLNVSISMEKLEGSWTGLRPKLSLLKIQMLSEDGQVILSADELTGELSLVRSLLDRRFSWRHLKFEGFDMAVQQADDGRWYVPGLPAKALESDVSNEKNMVKANDPYDVFLLGRRIHLRQARFDLHYFSGGRSQIAIPEIAIENDRDFHRITASVDVAAEQAFKMVVEGHGDPRDEQFTANGYLELKDFPTRKVVDALAYSEQLNAAESHNLNLKLWFKSDANKGVALRGSLSAVGDLEVTGKDIQLPKVVSAKINGRGQLGGDWQIGLKSFQADWRKKSSPVLDLKLVGKGRAFKGVNIGYMDVEPWVDIVLHAGLGNHVAEKLVRQLSPKGKLKDIQLKMTDPESGYVQLIAELENGSANAIKGAPALKNLNGHLKTSALSGEFNLTTVDGFTLFLPKVYHEPMHFEQAFGQIAWHVDLEKRFTTISSGLLRVVNAEEEGRGYLHLSLPFSKERGEQTMTLAIGIANTLAKNHKKYVPKTVPKHLYQWLDTSIKKGRIANARFLYHGSVEKNPTVSPTIQLYGDVYDGNLAFDPQWPELEGVDGQLVLDNRELDVRIKKASLLGNSVYDAEIKLVDGKNNSGRALAITGSLSSDVDAAMTLLKRSPIKRYIGETFDEWAFSGGVSAGVELQIPLKRGNERGLSHKIDVDFSDAVVDISRLDLRIDDINGHLSYQSELGITADTLTASIWGKRFDGSVSTLIEEESQETYIDFSGKVDMARLTEWTKRPELKFAEGESSVLGRLRIPGANSTKPLQLSVSSPLTGVSIALPEPFGKKPEAQRTLISEIQFYSGAEEFDFNYDNTLRLRLLNKKGEPASASVDINNFDSAKESTAPMGFTGKFHVAGELPVFDLEEWNLVKDKYLSYAISPSSVADEEEQSLIAHIDLDIDQFVLGALEIEDIQVKGERQSPQWRLHVDSQVMTGAIVVPEDASPISLDLDFIRLDLEREEQAADVKKTGKEMSSQSVLAKLDLDKLVDIDFSTDEFSLGESNYGAWAFKLRKVEHGVEARDIVANAKGLRIGSAEQGATMLWKKQDGKQSSEFKGSISAKDLGDVFDAFGQDRLLKSKAATITVEAGWVGAPDEVSLNTFEGVVDLDIRKGSFKRGAGGDETGLLRLLALMNFDTILRRLRLDFSDLAAQGYAYDHIYGQLDFRDGKIYLSDPMIVESSSSYIQMVGTIDIAKEKLDTDMVVTLPLAGGAAFATAMVVNLPAALGVYVMSKIFKKQVDRASSLNVEVRGAWKDPKVKVKKIFDAKSIKKKSQEVKQEHSTAESPGAP